MGKLQEGIRELDSLQNYSEVQLGSLLALIHAHKKCQPVDKEAVTQLDTKLKDERKRADDQVRRAVMIIISLQLIVMIIKMIIQRE